ncbi:kynureninase [Sistotremastrum suecicum HHB10207 ss-3]|uniref:Kynureninase n=1 Tax=Sistotremastrum suecicum HHB10207 ss-3 TaxID=1314776 RepID=A0A165X4H6_9AGAM|nr:kynureninase [Sistotremastrum suecicum HHB10207 ss-3]
MSFLSSDKALATSLDAEDPIRSFRDRFVLPTNRSVSASEVSADHLDDPCTYLCGNSLGPLPKRSRELVLNELDRWASLAVEGHFTPKGHGWVEQMDDLNPIMAELIGAKTSETACMSTLTANLHLLMGSFYKPTSTRYKILCETKAFPSDQYAFTSQVIAHGLDPQDAILELHPRPGEYHLREEDILKTISEQGSSIALVLFSGIQYYTGQFFPIKSVTEAAIAQGCIVGWDLAHAVGNVPLQLHDWNVDFAVWCSYKYLNSGPGGMGGLFVHEKWDAKESPRSAGWWGHTLDSRFAMPPTFSPILGAQGFQQSNPSVLAGASLLGSLEVFKEAGGMKPLREKSLKMTHFLESLLRKSSYFKPSSSSSKEGEKGFAIITPSDPSSRGCQLSLLILGGIMQPVFDGLKARGVIGDERKPDVIRLAPIPLYNTFEDCWKAARALEDTFASLGSTESVNGLKIA